QSEQIATEVQLAVAKLFERGADGKAIEQWRAGGLMVQFLPQSELRARHRDLHGGDNPNGTEAEQAPVEDEWQEARSLVATIEDS
ncbi:Hsp33 family molecular chaperone HslO, partial [Salmonella enterica]|nr:Hsp33 family molecular chaperone HslO [Salmonella enterica]